MITETTKVVVLTGYLGLARLLFSLEYSVSFFAKRKIAFS